MKQLELIVRRCMDCPYYYKFNYYLGDKFKNQCCKYPDVINGKMDNDFLADIFIYGNCPLPDLDIHKIKEKNMCPICGEIGEVAFRKCDGDGIHEKYFCNKCNHIWGDKI